MGVHDQRIASRDHADDVAGQRRQRMGHRRDGPDDAEGSVLGESDPAIAAGAHLLRTNGAPRDYRRALFAYNPDLSYVDAVLAQATRYRGAFAPGASAGARAAEWPGKPVRIG